MKTDNRDWEEQMLDEVLGWATSEPEGPKGQEQQAEQKKFEETGEDKPETGGVILEQPFEHGPEASDLSPETGVTPTIETTPGTMETVDEMTEVVATVSPVATGTAPALAPAPATVTSMSSPAQTGSAFPASTAPAPQVAPSSISRPKATSKSLLLLAWIMPVTALVCMVLQFWWQSDNPSDADWERANALVTANWREGDILRVEPGWATGALTHFAGLVHDRRGKLEPRELHGYKRLWVVGHLDKKKPSLPSEAFTHEQSWNFWRVQVHQYSITGVGSLLFDGREKLKDAAVVRLAPQKDHKRLNKGKDSVGNDYLVEEKCTLFVAGGWHCGQVHAWQNVKPVRFNVDYAPRDAIWAHPLDNHRQLKITWPSVPLADSIEFQMGWTSSASQHHHKGAPVKVQVWVGDELIHEDALPAGTEEWRVRELDVSKWAGKRMPVSVVNSTADFSSRQLLLNIRSWSGKPGW